MKTIVDYPSGSFKRISLAPFRGISHHDTVFADAVIFLDRVNFNISNMLCIFFDANRPEKNFFFFDGTQKIKQFFFVIIPISLKIPVDCRIIQPEDIFVGTVSTGKWLEIKALRFQYFCFQDLSSKT